MPVDADRAGVPVSDTPSGNGERVTALYKRVDALSAELEAVRAEVRQLEQDRDTQATELAQVRREVLDVRGIVLDLRDKIGAGSWWTRGLVVAVPAIVEGLRQAGVLH